MTMKPYLFITALIAGSVALLSEGRAATPLFDIYDIAGQNVTSLTERWTGLGSSSAPSNSGGLDPADSNPANRGILPDSMNSNTKLTKISGGGYRAGQSIYWQSGAGGFKGPEPLLPVLLNIMAGTVTPSQANSYVSAGYQLDGEGQFRINSTLETPFSLDSIVFQIAITGFGPTPEDFADGTYISSYQLTLMLSPVTLTINGNQQITGTFSNLSYALYDSGQGQGTTEVEEIWAFQWDLSQFSEPIESYTIGFANYPHSSIRGLQVDLVTAIPEPSTYAFAAVGGALALLVRKKQARNNARRLSIS